MSIRRRPAPTEPPTTDREAPDDMQQHAVSDEDEENEKRWQGRSGHGRDNSLFVVRHQQLRRNSAMLASGPSTI